MKLPKLPEMVLTQLGPVPVRIVRRAGKAKTTMGRYLMGTRRIEISSRSSRVVQWQVLYHEMAHIALFDAGLHNAFPKEQQEVICDVIATARVVELREVLRANRTGRKAN